MSIKQTVFAAALLLGSSGVVLAQNTAPNTATTGNPNNPPTLSPSSPAAQNPGVNPNAAGTVSGNRDYGTSTKPDTDTGSSNNTLERGANSFTEGQARRRIEDHGYTNVGELRKDQNSIWQAEAMKDGHRVRVGLDFRGNVAELNR